MRDHPNPPPDCPDEIAEQLPGYDPAQLRSIAEYATALAEVQATSHDETDEDDVDADEDLPEDVPAKATIVVKEINDNRYYYWQWREGDSIESKYKGPVDPDE